MATLLGKILADFTTSLATAITVGGTTATLQSATDDDGVALPTGRYFFTLDGGNSSKEHISCDLAGTALTNIKTVSRQGVEAAGVVRTHRIGTTVTLTDFAHIKMINDLVSGATNLNASEPLEYDGTATINAVNQLATKAYVDVQISAGAGQASTTTQGLVEVATQAETDAGTATGGTGAFLITPPSLLRAKAYHDYAADSVGTDAYAITITPAITAYATGQIFTFKAGTANTGACTLNVSGLGAKTIKKDVSSDLVTGDILANQIITVSYDGTNMQLISLPSGIVSNVTTPIVRTYLNAGSPATWTKPSGLKYVIVEVQAGGGNGEQAASASNYMGAGGGSGGYSRKLIAAASLGATETVTTGAAAGNSSFGAHATTTGGAVGASQVGGAGGTAASGDININGKKGQLGLTSTTTENIVGLGSGADSILGLGGFSTYIGDTGNQTGTAGTGYGSGGSGGTNTNDSGNPTAGGAGGAGIVIVTEFY